MNAQTLIDTAKALVAGDKGLLAMDESNPTCKQTICQVGNSPDRGGRRAYRELIVTTLGLGECISGVILYDETIRQQKQDGTPFLKVINDAGIIPGIKVDTGAKDLAVIPKRKSPRVWTDCASVWLNTLKWAPISPNGRAVIGRGRWHSQPGCIEANAQALARYAALCQEASLVPIVEPEVLMDGAHYAGAVSRSNRGSPTNSFQ